MRQISEADRRAYGANIWKSYLFQFLYSFQLWWPIWVIYLTDFRNFSLTQVSVLEALFWVVVVLAEVPTGAIADRFGRKTSLMLSGAFSTVAILVFGLATEYWIVLASYITWGIGITFHSGADSALTFESLKAIGKERDYPRVAGFGWAIFSLGTLGGMLLGAPLADATDLAFPILISAAIALITFIVAASMKEPDLPDGEVRLNYGRLLLESGKTSWRLPSVRSMLLLAAVLIAATNAAGLFSQPFLDDHDVPISLFGVAQAPMRVAGIIGAIMAYRIAAAFGLRWTMIATPVLLGGSYALLGAWASVYAFGATAVIVFAHSMMMPVATDYLNRRIPNNQRATILSLRQLITSIIIASFQPGLGVIADRVSLGAVFLASAAFIVVTAPLALVYWLRSDDDEPAAEGPVDTEPEAVPAG
jgi:predicted MFS family arabinose efflux permease